MRRAGENCILQEKSWEQDIAPSLSPPRCPAIPTLALLPAGHGIRTLIKLGEVVNLCCSALLAAGPQNQGMILRQRKARLRPGL